MRDREVKLTAVISAVFWAAGFTLVVAGIVWPRPGIPGLGVLIGCIGAVLNVRGYSIQVCRHIQHTFDKHEESFRLGREYERGQLERTNGEVRPLR